MRQPLISTVVLVAAALAGCSTHRNTPYANDPVLLHYKPTLNDSATIIAEKQWHHSPAKPPKPPVAQDKVGSELAIAPPSGIQVASPTRTETADQLLPPPPGVQLPSVASAPEPTGPPLPVRPMAAEPPSSVAPPAPVAVSEPPASTIAVPPPETGPPTAVNPPASESAGPAPAPQGVQVAKSETLAAAEPAPTSTPPEMVSSAAGHPTAPGKYGHDKDYHWLQGTLERHYRGYYCIRYCDPSVEDVNGGKVRLLESNMLDGFQEGDIIGVEGEVMPNSTDSFHTNPRFRIRDIWLVRKK